MTPPRVTPTSVVMHGVGETCVEVNGPQVEEERMCGPEGGSHLPLCQYHHTVNIMSKKSCLKGVKKAEGRVGKWRQLQFFIIRQMFSRARPMATVLPRIGDRLS